MIYKKWGDDKKAVNYFEQSLEIGRDIGRNDQISSSLRAIAKIYLMQGKYKTSMNYYQKALSLDRKMKMQSLLSDNFIGIGQVFLATNGYNKALEYFQKAFEIENKFNRDIEKSYCLNYIGLTYMSWDKYDKALNYIKRALQISQKNENKVDSSSFLSNIADIYKKRQEFDKALKFYKESLFIIKKIGNIDILSKRYEDVGKIYLKISKYNKAISYFKESINLKEKIRQGATGEIRRNYLESQIRIYQLMLSCYANINDVENAFSTIEYSRSRLLSERIGNSETQITIPSLKEIQKVTPKDTAIIVYANIDTNFYIQMVITNDSIKLFESEKSKIISELLVNSDSQIQNLIIGDYLRRFVNHKLESYNLRPNGIGREIRDVTETNNFNEIIKNYINLLVKNRNITQDNSFHKVKKLGNILYKFLLMNLEDYIIGKTKLIIMPDGILNFVPFEAMVNENGKYIVDYYQISYIQSITVWKLLKNRQYKKERKPLLAFGGAVYNEKNYEKEIINYDMTQLLSIRPKIYDDLDRGRSLANIYNSYINGTWNNLPGTLQEVAFLEDIVNDAEIMTKDKVSELHIKKLSSKGYLSDYKILHFATHALTVPEIPELSAIVLSHPNCNEINEDGYLRIGEISKLDIKSDFVNLSACNTALGKLYSGEGVVGLIEAFIRAGTKSISASLWKANDISTAKFMAQFYYLIKKHRSSYSEALTDVKRRFIKGDFGNKYKSPYYWAPFVFYGNNFESSSMKLSIASEYCYKPIELFINERHPKIKNSILKQNIIFLRSKPKVLSSIEVDDYLKNTNFVVNKKNGDMDLTFTDINNDYIVKRINNKKLVIDYTTGLMWQQAGAIKPLTWDETHQYIFQINNSKFAGYSDWRLPTIEELTSLLESDKKRALYIDPIFHGKQYACWTADEHKDKETFNHNVYERTAWCVHFNTGSVHIHNFSSHYFVRLVRSVGHNGIVFLRNEKYSKAIKEFTITIKKNSNVSKGYYYRGISYIKMGKKKEAIKDLTNAIKFDPKYCLAYYTRGLVYATLNNYNEAFSDVTNAIKLNQKFSIAYHNRGVLNSIVGNYKKAITDYNKSIDLNPNHFDTYFYRGRIYYQEKKLNKAIIDFSQAININNNNINLLYERALTYHSKGDIQKALYDYSNVIDLHSNFTKAYVNRSSIYISINRFYDAINDCNKAIQLDSNYSIVYANRAIAYLKIKRYDEAIADFNKIIETYPQKSELYYNRAIAHLKKGQYILAQNDIKKAKDLGFKSTLDFSTILKSQDSLTK